MDDRIMQAAMRAYEYASNDDDPISYRGLRAAVSRALDIQREEIAQAIEAQAQNARHDPGVLADGRAVAERLDDAARTAREHFHCLTGEV